MFYLSDWCCIWVTDVFVAQNGPVNLHGHRGEKSTKRREEEEGGEKRKEVTAVQRIWFGLPLLPAVAADVMLLFITHDLCWANVQIAFLSAIPGFGALRPERSQEERDCRADLQRHYLVSVTAVCHFPHFFFAGHLFSTARYNGGMADALCLCVLFFSCRCPCFREAELDWGG